MFNFYCPRCGEEGKTKQIPKQVRVNIRDGFGRPIYHYECPICHNLDAGFMSIFEADGYDYIYCQEVIKMYQNIRGIKKNQWTGMIKKCSVKFNI